MTIFAIETATAVWLGLGVVFAAFGFATEDHSDFGFFRKIGLGLSVVALWPFCFLPGWQKD